MAAEDAVRVHTPSSKFFPSVNRLMGRNLKAAGHVPTASAFSTPSKKKKKRKKKPKEAAHTMVLADGAGYQVFVSSSGRD